MYRNPFVHCMGCGPAFTLHPSEEIVPPGSAPTLRYVSAEGTVEGEAAIQRAVAALLGGEVVAVKGTGGFLFAADARDERAIRTLRARKRRPHKPFAVMARDMEWVRAAAHLLPSHETDLSSLMRPILLLPSKGAVAPSVAPNLKDIGIFLPGNGLQQLLLQQGPPLQVMTSANLSGSPIAHEDRDGLALLGTLADGVLLHDRPIRNAADDSVFRGTSEGPIPIRRSRGFVPVPIELPFSSPPLLALGGNEKNTLCIAEGRRAYLSQHLGDPQEPEAWRRLLAAADDFIRWTGIQPEAVVHDLHPDFPTTRWAQGSGMPCIPVQHHTAHFAACLAENRDVRRPTIGVVFDGTGLGADGTLWGGEFLLFDGSDFSRSCHLPALPLVGGEAAIRQPWRVALAALRSAGLGADSLAGVDEQAKQQVFRLLDHPERFPLATGAGRWFDAVAALCGFSDPISYEGQAAAELEAAAGRLPADPYPFELQGGAVDLTPMLRALVRDLQGGRPRAAISSRFHETLAQLVERGCDRLRAETGVGRVALTGGVFQNRLLLGRTSERLRRSGFEVLLAREVPPNDGGLSFGQVVAAALGKMKDSKAKERTDVSRHTG